MPARAASPVLALLLVLALGACSGDEPEPAPSPTADASPSPSPTPSPTPIVQEVEGRTETTVVDSSVSGMRVFPAGSSGDAAPSVDQGTVDAFTAEISAWLDAHLDAVQRGGVGSIDPTSPLAQDASEDLVAAVSSALADPSNPVASATYRMHVAAREVPEWADVVVLVERADGTTARARFVFVPGSPQPELVAAGPIAPEEVQP